MPLPYYEVDVPITSTTGLEGLHVFTGQATSTGEAVRLAHEVYAAALAAHQAGLEIPGKRPDGWGARGVRPGWEPNWLAASAGPWNDPYSWRHPHASDFRQ
ncbi:hypothetical protein [Streptomyces sp. IBSBF 2950]|uniref:hypothetical protein n=1 Tax=Streptomyces sp. IBSBF 2950 TaxID=2903528 RepID=UPI002FDBCCA9